MSLLIPSLPDLDSHWLRVAHHLGARPDTTDPHPGSGGHTRSGPVTTAEGEPAWLRIWCAPRSEGAVWEGPALAAHLFDERVPRPALLAEAAWDGEDDDRWAVQAHLYERLPSSPLSPGPVLFQAPDLSEQWWVDLAEAVASIREVPPHPERWVLDQGYVHRIPDVLPEFAGQDLTVQRWETAHGDLHWANLTAAPLRIIDWEGWGTAPAGFDAALLHAYALPVPDLARRVRAEFTGLLDTPSGRLAQLAVAAEVVQAADHDDTHAHLEPFVRRHLKTLL
ncbi:phosphotransferase [Nocardiopsis sp. CC223A]|uniref:phosphotransferase n=1 Tax=Nocardiopsis sp. CC223A TaxID=3044051 RepID=UPI00278C65B1|nr:phosphotransferase [Nocardiopsis sp. CC223A]